MNGQWRELPDRLCELLEYNPEELAEIPFTELLRPDERDEFHSRFFQRLREAQTDTVQVIANIHTGGGTLLSLPVTGVLIRDSSGNPRHILCLIRNDSERGNGTAKIQEERRKFESLFEHNPNPVYQFDLEGDFVAVNDKLVNFTGYSREELLHANFRDFVVEEDLERTINHFEDAAAGRAGEYEIQVRVRGGETRDIRVTKFPKYEGEKVTGVFGILQDITDQKRRKRELQKSEERFRLMFENNPNSVIALDREGKFVEVNREFEKLSGYTGEELKEKACEPFIHPDDRPESREHFRKALSGEIQVNEIRGITREGDQRLVNVKTFPVDFDNADRGVFCICEDVTEQRVATDLLKRSEQRFKSLFERNPHAVYSFDLDGNFVMANQSLRELTGYDREELEEMDFLPIVHPEDRDLVYEKFTQAATGDPQTYDARGIKKNGEIFEVQVTNLPIYIDDKIEGVFGIAHDITSEKEALRKLQESEERWHRLVEENPQPVQIVKNGKIEFINEAGARLYGASDPDELIGLSILEFTHSENEDRLKDRKERLEQQHHIEPDEHKIVRLDGQERYIEAHSIPIKYKGENAIQTVVHDITDRKQREKVIRESLSEKKILLQEIHHRVKNNLAVISGLLELQAMNSDDDAVADTLRQSQLRIQSMAMIHKKLYQSEALSNIGFDKYVQELVQTIKQTFNFDNKTIDTAYEMESVNLNINQAIPAALIINELVANAFKHAFPGSRGGTVTLHLTRSGEQVTLKVADDGVGVDPDFDLSSQQSLGMTLIDTLTKQLEGDLEIDSDGESGTEVTVRFRIAG